MAAKVFAPGPGIMVIGAESVASPAQVRRLQAAGIQVRLVSVTTCGLVSLPHALATLYDWGVRRLLVEGGGRVITAFIRERLVDEMVLEIVPVLLGEQGIPSTSDIGVQVLQDAPKLQNVRVTRAGTSILVQGRLA
jgi:riboflavin biosynthesis pyrimidine reductase